MMTEYAIRPIGTPLGPEDAASKYYECINWMCAEVERLAREREELESKLDNITCIVAEAKTHLSEVKLSSVSVAVVSALLADLTHALKAEGNK